MMKSKSIIKSLLIAILVSSCTGVGKNATPSDGGITIDPGDQIIVDMQDVIGLGINEYTVTLKTVTPDYLTSTVLYDLTSTMQSSIGSGTAFGFVMPKSIRSIKPILIVVDFPELNTQMTDLIYETHGTYRPGLASTLTYLLMKNYPLRVLPDYSKKDFESMKSLIQTKVDRMFAESEHLSLSSVPYKKLMRYLTNGFAFNIQFLNTIKDYGITYGYTTAPPPGLLASDTPENSTVPYEVATNFTLGGQPAITAPFNQSNTPSRILPGSAKPNPGVGLYIQEGKNILISAAGFDLDDDFMDKDFIISYTPRVLPVSTLAGLVVPEPTPEYIVMTNLAGPQYPDSYQSLNIGFNEALDTNAYVDGDTAYRDIYYMISDGMIRIPYHWNFKYADVNRQPQILRDAAGHINDTYYDAQLQTIFNDAPVVNVPGWLQHNSHCESDPNATPTPSGSGTVNYYTRIKGKKDGPWSCAFKVIDPDLDQDPNAAPDTFWYSVANIDNYTQALAGPLSISGSRMIWPPIPPAYTLTNPRHVSSLSLPTCTSYDGKTHYRCGMALYQIVIDNGVKVASDQKSDLMYYYDAVINDRPNSGLTNQVTIGRPIEFDPNPPMLINFSTPSPTPIPYTVFDLVIGGGGTSIHARTDTYLEEIFANSGADQVNPVTSIGLDPALTSAGARAIFRQGTPQAMSDYMSQPHALCDAAGTDCSGTFGVTLDGTTGEAITGVPGNGNLFGNSFRAFDNSSYKDPHEFDSTCDIDPNYNYNNVDSIAGWDQNAPAGGTYLSTHPGGVPKNFASGWTFEVDVVDYDNINLRSGEPTDPVFFTMSSDVVNAISLNGNVLEYCWASNPNNDPLYYQTYRAVSGLAAVDPDLCVWKTSPPLQMQPMPIYYTGKDSSGNVTTRKWVYHRLRLKWRPKDQGLYGKAMIDPPGYIKNIIGNIEFYGMVFVTKNGDTRDLTQIATPFPLYAQRKDMTPCLHNFPKGDAVFHQLAPSGFSINFDGNDENQTLWTQHAYAGHVSGRYEADITLQGTRAITDTNFLSLIPNFVDCSGVDKFTPAGASPTPPPSKNVSDPAVWYTDVSDPGNHPHLRIVSKTDPVDASNTGGQFCMDFKLAPWKKGANDYNEVWLIKNNNLATPITLSDPLMGSCANRANLIMQANQTYFAVAVANGNPGCGGHTVGQVLWSDANSTATVAVKVDPTLPAYGNLPAGTSMTLDLFPSLYQADYASTNPDAANGLFMTGTVLDTFILNPVTKYADYTGFNVWVPADAAHTAPYPSPVPVTAPYIFSYQILDWDNQPNNLVIVGPTPNPAISNVYYRSAPGNSSHLQVFIKNHATATFPIQASDLAGGLENDPYDIMSYTFSTPYPVPSPNATPVFQGNGRATCTTPPAGYPGTLSTLDYVGLQNYKTCSVSWTPLAADDGKKFSYQFDVQDNFGGGPGQGVGGKHPTGISSLVIPNNNLPNANGPTVPYFLDIESLENNIPPYFTTSGGGALATAAYVPAGGAAGWTTVYTPTGIQPPKVTGTPPFAANPTNISIGAGDYLQSSVPIILNEGSSQAFTVYAKDDNVTPSLKTLTAIKPDRVLIVNGPLAGKTYIVPSFAAMTMSTVQNIAAGTAQFSFNWTPTDAEANFLSNSGGFLIPVKVSDQTYFPAADPGFPVQFDVQSMSSTVWIWAKLNVVNNSPLVYYLNGAVETPLAGATLIMQTGSWTAFTVRTKDADLARWTQTGDHTGFNPNYSGPPFTTASPAGTPYLSGLFVVQDFKLNGNPATTDLGLYGSPSVTVTDPGDQSLGLAVNPDAGVPPKAQVFAASNSFGTSFNIQVIGKPVFLAPSPAPASIYAYSNKQFYYPISMSVSRPTEKLQPFFIGIDQSTAMTPLKTTIGGTGIYINENYVLRWPDSTFIQVNNPLTRTVPIYGVVQAGNCNVGPGPFVKTLIRYNEGLNTMQTCALNAANLAANVSTANLIITLVDGATLPSASPFSLTELDRTYAPAPTPSNLVNDLNNQFAEFIGRCAYCAVAPVTSNSAPSGYKLNPVGIPGSNGFALYNFSLYQSAFQFITAAGAYTINRIYKDTAPTSARNIIASAYKGETLTFKATVSGAAPTSPYNQYRWYVNGCLVNSGAITSNNLSYNMLVGSLSGGANNDCTGEYGFAETGAGNLGQLVVRLSVMNTTEAAIPATDNSSLNKYYVWKVNVINTDPNLIGSAAYAKSAPIILNASYMTGNSDVQFGAATSYSGKNFFTFTDLSTITGLKIRAREFTTNGDLTGPSNLLLTCDTSFASQPQWIGMHPAPDGKYYISASTNTSYPLGASANAAYGSKSQTCFTNALTTAAPSQPFINYGGPGSSIPAGYLSFSKYTQSVNPLSAYTNTGALYTAGSNDTNFYLLDGIGGSYLFWSYALAGIYPATPAELLAPYNNNAVRRTVINGNNFFQLIGATSNGSNGWRGFIEIGTIAPGTFNKVAVTVTNRIMFADPVSGPAPLPGVNDCQFTGTPIDAVYVPTLDTLFVSSFASDTSTKGHIVSITNATTAPKCNNLGNITNPSLSASDHNPNMTHMDYDATRGVIYGIVNQGPGLPGQFYTLDIYTGQLVTRDISSTISPSELIYSPNINGAYLFDKRKSVVPTLYRIW